jgi:hypothetical protein
VVAGYFGGGRTPPLDAFGDACEPPPTPLGGVLPTPGVGGGCTPTPLGSHPFLIFNFFKKKLIFKFYLFIFFIFIDTC